MASQSTSRPTTLFTALALLVVLVSVAPGEARGQAAGTVAELLESQNLRAEPNERVIGRLEEGTRVTVVERIDGWTRVRVRGSVWMESLIVRDGGDFDLQVSATDGENLRAEPSGDILGRLGEGTLLVETGREPGWIHVERVAWIWSQSLGFADDTGEFAVPVRIDPDPSPPNPGAPPAETDPPEEVPEEPDDEEPAAAPAPEVEPGMRLSLGAGSLLLFRPGADTLAVLSSAGEGEVLERDGDWIRVQLEAWVPLPEAEGDEEGLPLPPLRRGVTPTDLASSPDAYRGAHVELELQFISVEVAEAIRTDFTEGERFLLTRSSGAGQRFVYVALGDEAVDEFRGLAPLDRIRVRGQVRTGAAALTGHPVLDLLEWERIRR